MFLNPQREKQMDSLFFSVIFSNLDKLPNKLPINSSTVTFLTNIL